MAARTHTAHGTAKLSQRARIGMGSLGGWDKTITVSASPHAPGAPSVSEFVTRSNPASRTSSHMVTRETKAAFWTSCSISACKSSLQLPSPTARRHKFFPVGLCENHTRDYDVNDGSHAPMTRRAMQPDDRRADEQKKSTNAGRDNATGDNRTHTYNSTSLHERTWCLRCKSNLHTTITMN